jgi:glucosamine-6-phosphate deaminase
MPTPRVLHFAGATIQVFPDARSASRSAAEQIASVIREAVPARGKAVLGLATGSTPILIYDHLVALHEAGSLRFANVTTYNLDEYYPIEPTDSNSYRNYMQRHLFRFVDIAPNRAHVLDGTVPEAFASGHAAEYDRWIEADGGLDVQLLGIGRNGHIGFNEPSDRPLDEMRTLRTRLVDLHPVTIADAAKDFGGEAKVIRRALTVGVGPILAARSIVVVALGESKAEAVSLALTGPASSRVPASLLQSVPGKVVWFLDEDAAKKLH